MSVSICEAARHYGVSVPAMRREDRRLGFSHELIFQFCQWSGAKVILHEGSPSPDLQCIFSRCQH